MFCGIGNTEMYQNDLLITISEGSIADCSYEGYAQALICIDFIFAHIISSNVTKNVAYYRSGFQIISYSDINEIKLSTFAYNNATVSLCMDHWGNSHDYMCNIIGNQGFESFSCVCANDGTLTMENCTLKGPYGKNIAISARDDRLVTIKYCNIDQFPSSAKFTTISLNEFNFSNILPHLSTYLCHAEYELKFILNMTINEEARTDGFYMSMFVKSLPLLTQNFFNAYFFIISLKFNRIFVSYRIK